MNKRDLYYTLSSMLDIDDRAAPENGEKDDQYVYDWSLIFRTIIWLQELEAFLKYAMPSFRTMERNVTYIAEVARKKTADMADDDSLQLSAKDFRALTDFGESKSAAEALKEWEKLNEKKPS